MRPDIDLEFLQNCTNADLRTLCDILTKDNEGNIRLSEKLTDTDSYYNCYPHNTKGMWQDIAAELQRFGGNTFLNLYRHGRGPAYESIVLDVCKKMEVEDITEHDTAEEMEQKLLFKLTETMISKLSEAELAQLMEELNIEKRSYKKQGVMAALLVAKAVNKKLFYKMMTYIFRFVSEMLVGRGIMAAGAGLIARGTQFLLGPAGWIICGAWTAWDIAGPAYRVTIPAVLQVSYMRMKFNSRLLTYNT